MDCEDCRHLTVVGLHDTGSWTTPPADPRRSRVWAATGHVWVAAGHVWVATGHVWAATGHVWAATGHVWAATGHVWAATGHVCHLLLSLLGCLTSQQHASVSQGRICSDNFTCCHIEIQVADRTFHLTQSQYTDTGPTSSSADPITPGAWQDSHWSANFEVTGMTRPRKNPGASGIRTRDLPLSRRTP